MYHFNGQLHHSRIHHFCSKVNYTCFQPGNCHGLWNGKLHRRLGRWKSIINNKIKLERNLLLTYLNYISLHLTIYTQYQKYAYFVFKHCHHNAIFQLRQSKRLGQNPKHLMKFSESWENDHFKSSTHQTLCGCLKQMAAEGTLKHLQASHCPQDLLRAIGTTDTWVSQREKIN